MTVAEKTYEVIALPNGSRLHYCDEDHSYWRCKPDGSKGKRLTAVSTACEPFDWRPDALMRWAANLTLDGVVRGFAGREIPVDPHVLRQNLEDSGLTWEQIRDDAAERGTNIHMEMLHALARGEDVPDLDSLPAEQRGYGQAVMKWWLDKKPRVLEAEQVVLSEEHGFAGRFDLRAEIGPAVTLVDAKTSGYISTKAHAQLAGYDLSAIECGIGPSTVRTILQLHPDGTYTEIPACADHEDFLAALEVYRRASKIGNAARKYRVAA